MLEVFDLKAVIAGKCLFESDEALVLQQLAQYREASILRSKFETRKTSLKRHVKACRFGGHLRFHHTPVHVSHIVCFMSISETNTPVATSKDTTETHSLRHTNTIKHIAHHKHCRGTRNALLGLGCFART